MSYLAIALVVLLVLFHRGGVVRMRWRRNARRYAKRQRRAALGYVPGVPWARRMRRQVKLMRRRYHPTWVYRLPAALPCPGPAKGQRRDATGKMGEHLYVGVAELGRLRKRWREHRGLVSRAHHRKVWAWRVCWWLPLPVLPGVKWWGVFPSVRLYWTRLAAEEAELKAIREELPTYNIVGVRPRPRRAAA